MRERERERTSKQGRKKSDSGNRSKLFCNFIGSLCPTNCHAMKRARERVNEREGIKKKETQTERERERERVIQEQNDTVGEEGWKRGHEIGRAGQTRKQNAGHRKSNCPD